MAREERIGSTEQLLEYIRDRGNAPLESDGADTHGASSSQESPEPGSTAPAGPHAGRGEARAPLRARTEVGVELGRDYARFLACCPKRGIVLDTREVTFSVSFGEQGHRHELGQALESFLGSSPRVRLWAVAPFLRGSVHSISIPRVRAKEVPNTVYWTLKRETDFEDSEYVLDYEIQSDIREKGIDKKRVLACLMHRRDVEAVSGLFRDLGHPLSGLSLPSVALQHFFLKRSRPVGEDVFAVLHLGRDGARTAVYEQGLLRLCREVRPNLDRMVEECFQGTDGRGQPPEAGADAAEGGQGGSAGAKERLLALFSGESPREDDISDQALECVRSSVERLEGHVERTFSYFTRNMGGAPVQKLYFSGEVLLSEEIGEHITNELNLPARNLDVFDHGPSAEAACPRRPLERCKHLLPYVLARTQDEHTLNFVHTYRDKTARRVRGRINAGLVAAAACCALLLAGVHLLQMQELSGLRTTTRQLQAELESFNPDLDRKQVLQLVSDYKRQQRRLRDKAQRYYPVGLLSDLFRRTPSGIRLVSLAGRSGSETSASSGNGLASLKIEGVVLAGDNDSLLASYIMALRASAFLEKPRVKRKETETLPRQGRAMRFILTVGCRHPHAGDDPNERTS